MGFSSSGCLEKRSQDLVCHQFTIIECLPGESTLIHESEKGVAMSCPGRSVVPTNVSDAVECNRRPS